MNSINIHSKILVSVVIPAYNSARYIRQAIDSVLIQDVPLEIIVIDDASTDALRQTLFKYNTVKDFIYIKNAFTLGPAESRNIGIRKARGKYIAFLDADDWWMQGKLKMQIACINKYQCVLCYTARELSKEDGELLSRKIPVRSKVNYHQLLCHNSIVCSSVLAEREVMLRCSMRHSEYHEDYLAWLSILKKYGTAYGINQPLIVYRLSNGGKSRNKLHSAKMTYGVYRVLGISRIGSLFFLCSHLGHGIVKYSFNRGYS